jgi:hypothetical protein
MNSRRLQKTPELNRSDLQENIHLEGQEAHTRRRSPAGAQPRPTGPVRRLIGPPGPNQALLREGSSTASYG